MSEADQPTTSNRSPSGSEHTASQLDKGLQTRPLRGLEPSIVQLGGYGLLAYGLLNIIRIVFLPEVGSGPDGALARMAQLASLYPVLLLGPVLLFAPQGALKEKGLWRALSRWLVLLLALIFLLFIPLSLYHRVIIIQRDANQVNRFQELLQKRKQEILASVQTLKSIPEFGAALASFPEVRRVVIRPDQSPDSIREAIRVGLDRGIANESARLKTGLQKRRSAINATVRDVISVSGMAGLSLLVLATYLLPGLSPARLALIKFKENLGKAAPPPSKRSRRRKLARRVTGYFSYLAKDVARSFSLPRSRKRSSRNSKRR